MPSVFFLASDLGLTGPARQLGRLAAALPRDQFRVEVGVLGPADAPVAGELRGAGVPVRALPVRSVFDVTGFRAARKAVACATPDVVHGWGPSAVRVMSLVAPTHAGGSGPRRVASAAAPAGGAVSAWLTGLALRRTDRVVAGTWAEAERYRRIGVSGECLTRIAPGVPPPAAAPDRPALLREWNLPAHARLIITAGSRDTTADLKAAVWAFDILRYDIPDVYLLVCGGGVDRAGLDRFGRALAFDDYRVRFPGDRPDLPALLQFADVAWVTHARGGVNLALEAMAAGRPVVGWRTADLSEVVADGDTGVLVSPGDKAELATQTYRLLQDPSGATRQGDRGRTRVAEQFPVGRMADRYGQLYLELAAHCGTRP